MIHYVRSSNPTSPLPIIYLAKNNNQMGWYEFSIKKKVKKSCIIQSCDTYFYFIDHKWGGNKN